MKRCVIEINDSGIELADQTGIRRTSPGYAFCAGREMLVGEQAAARLRLNPRAGHDRFWSRLDQNPLPSAIGPAHSHADLAWFHLNDLWAPVCSEYEQVILTVGADDDPARLSLLLAVARALKMPVKAVAASAVAAAAHPAARNSTALAETAKEFLVLDIHLHEMTAERVKLDDGYAELGERRRFTQHGLSRLYDLWAQVIAEAFLRQTRFDPLHSAGSEQQLYDRLPHWLEQLAGQARLRAGLTSGGHEFAVDLDREALAAAAAPLYQPLLESAAQAKIPVLLRHRLRLLPGFSIRLLQLADGILLTANAVAETLLSYAPEATDDSREQVPYHTRLPLAGGRLDAPSATATSDPPATHLSDGANLWLLGGERCTLPPGQTPAPGAAELQLSGGRLKLIAGASSAVSVNGRRLNGEQNVEAGDELTIGERRYTLLRLRD